MKDALGHGSNKRPIPGSPMHAKTNDELRFIQRDAHEAGRNAQQMGDERGVNKYADQVNDASTVLGYRSRGGKSDAPADALASGPKSAPAPIHDAWSSTPGGDRGDAGPVNYDADGKSWGLSPGGRHGYSPDAVNNAIASSNRSGRRIGGREAKMIHALLKGR
jgi:hypothetical protein